MCRELLHLYGSFSINSYGLMIVIGLVVTYILIKCDPIRRRLMSSEQLLNAFTYATLAGVISGRLLFVFSNWRIFDNFGEMFAVWDGGFSLLGSVLGICLTLPAYLIFNKIPVLPFFDLVSCYAPLLVGISRIGCFFAGCCYGKPSSVFWAVTYSCPDCLAPLGIALHPAQLYSSILLVLIFVFLRFVIRPRFVIPGQIFTIYLMLTSLERFLTDFVRQDREFIGSMTTLSLHQCLAAALFVGALVLFLTFTAKARRSHESI